ncbi:MAG: hypothetical protein ACREBC_08210, partial [Pyrinomonadaceae bacterium]
QVGCVTIALTEVAHACSLIEIRCRSDRFAHQKFHLKSDRLLEGSQSSRVHWIYRWLACAIDMVLILMLTLFLSFFRIDFIDPLWHFLINAVSVYFFFFFFGYRFGRTPGLWLTGLWVTSLIDDRMTWKQAAIRVLLNWTPAADRVSSTRVRFDERRLWRLSGKPLVVRIIVSLANLIIMWSIVSFVFCLIVGYLSDMGSPPFMSGRARAIFYGYFGLYPDEFSTSPEFVASILVAHMTNIAYWIVLLKLIEYKKLIGLRIAAGILCIYSFKTIPIVIFLLTLHPSVGRYCQGVLPHMRVFLEYRRRKKNQP